MSNNINKIISVKNFPSLDMVAWFPDPFASGRVPLGGGTRPWAKGGTRNQTERQPKNQREISVKLPKKIPHRDDYNKEYQ